MCVTLYIEVILEVILEVIRFNTSSPENKMVSFVGNPTLKFFNTVWWLSIELLTKSRKSAFLGKEISFNNEICRVTIFRRFACCLLHKKNTHLPARLIKKRRYYSIKRSATEERIVISISIAIVIFSVCARKSFHRAKNERERERRGV